MNQTMIPTTRVRPTYVRPETEAVLRDMAFVLTLTQRVRVELQLGTRSDSR